MYFLIPIKGLLLEGREIDKRNLLLDMIQSGNSIFKVEPIFQHLTQCLSKKLKDRSGRYLNDRKDHQ